MKPKEFPEQTNVYGKHQPQYLPLPAHITKDGHVITCWKTEEGMPGMKERIKFLITGTVWTRQLTFGHPLQPQECQIIYPFVKVTTGKRTISETIKKLLAKLKK